MLENEFMLAVLEQRLHSNLPTREDNTKLKIKISKATKNFQGNLDLILHSVGETRNREAFLQGFNRI
jgi:hypothetical protein